MFQRASRHADGEVIEIGAARVRLTVSARARRVSLRVDRARGEVLAIAPSLRRLGEAAAFAHERRGWIAERVLELKPPTRLTPGLQLTVFANPPLGPLARAVSLEAATLGARLAAGGRRGRRGLRQSHRPVAEAPGQDLVRAAAGAALPGAGPAVPKFSVVDARTRWGSCTPRRARSSGRHPGCPGAWRWPRPRSPTTSPPTSAPTCCTRTTAPPSGPRTRRLIGDERPHRAWLKAHGGQLHGFA